MNIATTECMTTFFLFFFVIAYTRTQVVYRSMVQSEKCDSLEEW